MSEHVHEQRICADTDCAEAFKDYGWAAIKAHDKGWFEQRDGTVWCPSHNPSWVKDWREKQAANK